MEDYFLLFFYHIELKWGNLVIKTLMMKGKILLSFFLEVKWKGWVLKRKHNSGKSQVQHFVRCNLTCPHALSRVLSALTMGTPVFTLMTLPIGISSNSTQSLHFSNSHCIILLLSLCSHSLDITITWAPFMPYLVPPSSLIEPDFHFYYDFHFFYKYIFFPSFRSSLALFLPILIFSQSFQQCFY